mgnify:CR=1 FL=1
MMVGHGMVQGVIKKIDQEEGLDYILYQLMSNGS